MTSLARSRFFSRFLNYVYFRPRLCRRRCFLSPIFSASYLCLSHVSELFHFVGYIAYSDARTVSQPPVLVSWVSLKVVHCFGSYLSVLVY